VAVDLLGYALGGAIAVALLACAARERRWWSWLQVAGIAVLTVAAVNGGDLPSPAEQVARAAGPGLLVLGLLAWRLHWDAGWFGGDDLRPPDGAAGPGHDHDHPDHDHPDHDHPDDDHPDHDHPDHDDPAPGRDGPSHAAAGTEPEDRP
jgi:hypothetical protein